MTARTPTLRRSPAVVREPCRPDRRRRSYDGSCRRNTYWPSMSRCRVRPGRPPLYRVADSNLRLYLAAGRAAHEQIRRGRPDIPLRVLHRRWLTWRGKAVESLVRESLALACAAGATPWPDTEVVGSWWNRQVDPQVDLVGADRYPVASRIYFAGSVKWLGTPFDRHDLAALTRSASAVPGFAAGAAGLAVVSLSGMELGQDSSAVQLSWAPDECSPPGKLRGAEITRQPERGGEHPHGGAGGA